MRGNILNRRGEYNRCSLTRLGVDKKLEGERWKKSWEENQITEQDVSLAQENWKGRNHARGERQKEKAIGRGGNRMGVGSH